MTLAHMMKEERTKPAVRLDSYSTGERYGFVELLVMRVIRENPAFSLIAVNEKLKSLFTDAKVNYEWISAMQDLTNVIGALISAGHIKGEVDEYLYYDCRDTSAVTKKGRSYMLNMPKTVKNAADRIMRPYTVLDRFAAAIPTIPKQAKKRRRRRRRSKK